ncbi:MAG: hypothetical protein RLZZ312_996 [Bacteroidota bacterium]
MSLKVVEVLLKFSFTLILSKKNLQISLKVFEALSGFEPE